MNAKVVKKSLRPFACGAPKTESRKYPGKADFKVSLAHYAGCTHPGCRARLGAWENLRTEFKKPGAVKVVRS